MGPVSEDLQLSVGRQHEEDHPVTQVKHQCFFEKTKLYFVRSPPSLTVVNTPLVENRNSLLSLSSGNIGDADMSRLCAATSLMQIDDSIMR